jgi:hypothetical protein
MGKIEAFSARDKSMHINSGGYHVIPASEVVSWDDFLASYLEEKIC